MKTSRLSIPAPKASEVPALLDNKGIAFQAVACVNWPEYPYCPEAKARIAITDDALLLHYHVNEQATLARYDKDGDRVWTDSCMECFVSPAHSEGYYNIECSCIGTLLIGYGTGRNDRRQTSAEALSTVDRYATLGREPFGLRNEPTTWDLALVIPFSVFGDDAPLFKASELRFNIYKCGDDLPTPHFVSLFPIPIQEPDFHRPDFFDTLSIE